MKSPRMATQHGVTVLLLMVVAGQAARSSTAATPVQKVIELIQNMRDEVVADGEEEAKTYGKFSCWCKDKTEEQSGKVKDTLLAINDAAAVVEEKSALRNEKTAELADTKSQREKDIADLSKSKTQCEKDSDDFKAKLAQFDHDIGRLNGAINSMKSAAPSALIQLRQQVAVDLKSLIEENEGPADYESHTGGIVNILQRLLDTFNKKRMETFHDFKESERSCSETQDNLSEQIRIATDETIPSLENTISESTQKIQQKREELVSERSTMQDTDTYLKDVTKMCEDRAEEFDQRSTTRAQELDALAQVLDILNERVSGVEGKRALIQARAVPDRAHSTATSKADTKVLSFLQSALVKIGNHNDEQHRERGEKVVALLRKKGQELGSVVLADLATHVSIATSATQDPFAKVKDLIQQLIERLVKEATEEASKKGFCDEQMGLATSARDSRWMDMRKQQTKISGNGVAKEEAEVFKQSEEEELQDTEFALGNATDMRNDERALNLETIANATSGYEAIKEVLGILRKFYGASSLMQVPDAAPSESKGAYAGKQAAAGGIIGMIEVIKSDFERTLRVTNEEESKAQADFEQFKQKALATIKSKETSIENLRNKIGTLDSQITSDLDDLNATTALLDKALSTLIELNPMCVDSGMTFQQRKEKREAEIEALKCASKALKGEDC